MEVKTLAFADRFFRTVDVGQSSSMWSMMEASFNITAVTSAPNLSSTAYLFVGLDLVPPRFVRLW